MKLGVLSKISLSIVLFSSCLKASEGIWDTGELIFKKFTRIYGPCEFDGPILSDTPRCMVGRAERARIYLSTSNRRMQARNVVSVLGDSHVFLSSLEPYSGDWSGSNIFCFIDALVSPFDSAFLKNFLANYSSVSVKSSKFFDTLKTSMGIQGKQVLIDCLKKASERINSNISILHKAIAERANGLNNMSGHLFFRELTDIIEVGNIKNQKVIKGSVQNLIGVCNITELWQIARDILNDMDSVVQDESTAMKITSRYVASLVSHVDFLRGLIGDTVIVAEKTEKNLGVGLSNARQILQSILEYSYTRGAKVADIIKMLKESGKETQDFFHAESLLAVFMHNHDILCHCGDDIVFYTQRDMCAVCEATWRKIADSNRVRGKIYVLSSEPYAIDESWNRDSIDPDCKLVKIPLRRGVPISNDTVSVRTLFETQSIEDEVIVQLRNACSRLLRNSTEYLSSLTPDFKINEVLDTCKQMAINIITGQISTYTNLYLRQTSKMACEQMTNMCKSIKEKIVHMNLPITQEQFIHIETENAIDNPIIQKVLSEYNKMIDVCANRFSEPDDTTQLESLFTQYEIDLRQITGISKLKKPTIIDTMFVNLESIKSNLMELTAKQSEIKEAYRNFTISLS